MVRPSVAVGGGAAVLLVGLIAFVATGDPGSDLETEAMAPATSTTQVIARAVGDDEGEAPRELVESPPSFATTWDFDEYIREVTPSTTTTTTTTTTTIATSTSAVPTSASAGPAPVRIPRPSCAAGLGSPVQTVAPFTGQNAAVPAGLPAVVVKVSNNNSGSRRALIGLDQADIVFEERIEYSATRFAAVFHSQLPANVGPVRSGRTTDIEIVWNLGLPVLGYSGSNPGVARQFASAAANDIFVPVVNTDTSPFARDSRYRAPDNLFVDPVSLGACGGGGTPRSIFDYGATTSASAKPAASLSLQARSPFRFDWDASSGTWRRYQDGTAHVTRTGEPLAPDNVVVLFVPYVTSAIDASSVDAETVGSGTAWVLRDGTITEGSWSRDRPSQGYALSDAGGAAVSLAPGSTWVVLAPAGTASWS